MAYTRNPTWQNSPSVATPITAATLENIEGGLVAAAGVADSNTTAIAVKYTKPSGGIPNSDLATPGGTVAATTTTQGIVKLAGDFGGTADLPTVPGLAGKLSSTDPSVINARTPLAHKASHATGGSDVLLPSAIGAEPAITRTGAVAGQVLTVAADGTTLALASTSLVASNHKLAGQTFSQCGHSYLGGTGSSNGTGHGDRLATALRAAFNRNYGVGGSFSYQAAWKLTQNFNNVQGGVVIIDCIYNDLAYLANTNGVQAFTYSVQALVEMARGRGYNYSNQPTGASASPNYVGTWGAVASTAGTNSFIGTVNGTTTQNDKVDVPWVGDRVMIMLRGQFGSGAGATISVTYAGTVIKTVSLDNLAYVTGQYVPVPIILSGYGPGEHLVTLTKTDATGTKFEVDSIWYPADGFVAASKAPFVVLYKQPPTAGISGGATLDRSGYNNAMDTIAASYPSKVIVIDPSAVLNGAAWDPTLYIYTDGVHPNDAGTRRYVYLAAPAIITATTPSTIELGSLSYADTHPTITPTALSDSFNRVDNAYLPGTPSDGLAPWQNLRGRDVWYITSNTLALTWSNQPSALVRESGKSDATISVQFATIGAAAGIVFRCTDLSNFWFATSDGNLKKNVANTVITVGTFAALVNGDTLSVITSGSTITVQKNGTGVLTVTDAAFQLSTLHGVGGFTPAGATRWDNFSVA